VVLVHGTASSPARWAELYNELLNDPVLHGRYQYWLYQYNTGQPVLYSAMLLRRALRATVAEVDPEGKDPALRRMVVIGHSQGGLLTKLMAIDSGDHFWRNISKQPFESLQVSDETRALLREALFFEPFPSIERVVFMSTPHRGSYQASGIVLDLVWRLITLPGRLANQLQGLATDPQLAHLARTRLPNAVDNMSPGHPFLKALNECPIDPRIKAHSIIAVQNPGPPENQNDGVVAYQSAHIQGVQSEAIVVSGHSVQGTQAGINEVRRILREHAGAR
jgi:pimeloyl-ACP methyl ester carboxylesterase